MKKHLVRICVNEEEVELAVAPNRTLLELLREDLGLMGVKEGCGEGVCGACTVLMDGRPVRSCLTLAVEAQDTTIATVEGLARDGLLDPLQQSFVDHGAIQCGFCTAGMVIASKALLAENPNPSDDQIKHALSGHFCRCTGYAKVVEAVRACAPSCLPEPKS
ncbi:MAG: aerobic carbon-monoxide dehydrogenase small subunit [Thermodesulfobacteriota bacterium]|nr:aerobic carbon-monoxide dehydrogenase small subunit [Thermodesulfobacteriota bacterium]